jgi:CRISPR system Cascade subunit CasC
MSEFIQLHLLTNYAPANLNRDDLGRPKTAKMGGVDRLRISSQSLKRAWRTSHVFESKLSGNIGIRTKKFGHKIYEYLLQRGVSEKNALEWTKILITQFGKGKADKKNPLIELDTEQLVHIAPEEEAATLKLAETLSDEKRPPSKEELALLRKNVSAADIALFGRMLASSPKYNVEAAAQVAHAITVNRVVVEDDYFTAVDDLNTHEEDAGSAHIGESGFGSGVFYTYACINKSLLIENLENEELANRAIKALTEAAATVAPSGKQNSFASRARALYILAEKGEQQPRQLSSAFLQPVTESDMVNSAIARLEALRANMDKVYGKCADDFVSMNVEKGEGSFKDILDFVGA